MATRKAPGLTPKGSAFSFLPVATGARRFPPATESSAINLTGPSPNSKCFCLCLQRGVRYGMACTKLEAVLSPTYACRSRCACLSCMEHHWHAVLCMLGKLWRHLMRHSLIQLFSISLGRTAMLISNMACHTMLHRKVPLCNASAHTIAVG